MYTSILPSAAVTYTRRNHLPDIFFSLDLSEILACPECLSFRTWEGRSLSLKRDQINLHLQYYRF